MLGAVAASLALAGSGLAAELVYQINMTNWAAVDANREAGVGWDAKISSAAPASRTSVGIICVGPTNTWAWSGPAPQIPQLTSRVQDPSGSAKVKLLGTTKGAAKIRYYAKLGTSCPGEILQVRRISARLREQRPALAVSWHPPFFP